MNPLERLGNWVLGIGQESPIQPKVSLSPEAQALYNAEVLMRAELQGKILREYKSWFDRWMVLRNGFSNAWEAMEEWDRIPGWEREGCFWAEGSFPYAEVNAYGYAFKATLNYKGPLETKSIKISAADRVHYDRIGDERSLGLDLDLDNGPPTDPFERTEASGVGLDLMYRGACKLNGLTTAVDIQIVRGGHQWTYQVGLDKFEAIDWGSAVRQIMYELNKEDLAKYGDKFNEVLLLE